MERSREVDGRDVDGEEVEVKEDDAGGDGDPQVPKPRMICSTWMSLNLCCHFAISLIMALLMDFSVKGMRAWSRSWRMHRFVALNCACVYLLRATCTTHHLSLWSLSSGEKTSASASAARTMISGLTRLSWSGKSWRCTVFPSRE